MSSHHLSRQSTASGLAGSPIASTIASAPRPGVSYRHVSWNEFSLMGGPTAVGFTRVLTANGVMATGTGVPLVATVEVPTGARLYDVEFYAANQGTTPFTFAVTPWLPMGGSIVPVIVDGDMTPGTGVRALRLVVPPSSYEETFKLALTAYSDGTLAKTINGARLGFAPGAVQTVLLPTPVRVFDSRTSGGGKVQPNTFRDISLASAIPTGAVGAVGAGSLRVGAGGATPTATAVQWYRTGSRLTGSTHTAVSGTRAIRIAPYAATGATHAIVDLVGYLV